MKKHRLERIEDKLVQRIEEQIEGLTLALQGDSPLPPFSVKLTEEEQLEQYFALTAEKWPQIIQEHGLDEAMRYSGAMLKLVEKHVGPVVPQAVMVQPSPEDMAAAPQQQVMLDPMSGQAAPTTPYMMQPTPQQPGMMPSAPTQPGMM